QFPERARVPPRSARLVRRPANASPGAATGVRVAGNAAPPETPPDTCAESARGERRATARSLSKWNPLVLLPGLLYFTPATVHIDALLTAISKSPATLKTGQAGPHDPA